jgi:hypothetical protein
VKKVVLHITTQSVCPGLTFGCSVNLAYNTAATKILKELLSNITTNYNIKDIQKITFTFMSFMKSFS